MLHVTMFMHFTLSEDGFFLKGERCWNKIYGKILHT